MGSDFSMGTGSPHRGAGLKHHIDFRQANMRKGISGGGDSIGEGQRSEGVTVLGGVQNLGSHDRGL